MALDPFIYAIVQTFKKTYLVPFAPKIESGDLPILVSFSAGPDSVFLLYCLVQMNLKIELIYFNHQLRSLEEQTQDIAIVQYYANQFRVPYRVRKLPIQQYTQKHSCSVETAGHQLRYRHLVHFAALLRCPAVATAHHLDDQAETMVHQLIRGSRQGGIPERLSLEGVDLVRPLLSVKKRDILAFLELKKMPYSVDSTNQESLFIRNQIRHEILPKLERINPNYRESLQSLGHYLQALNGFMEAQMAPVLSNVVSSNEGLEVAKTAIQSLHPFLQKACIYTLLSKLERKDTDKQITQMHVEAIWIQLQKKTGRVDLPESYQAIVTPTHLRLVRSKI